MDGTVKEECFMEKRENTYLGNMGHSIITHETPTQENDSEIEGNEITRPAGGISLFQEYKPRAMSGRQCEKYNGIHDPENHV